MLPDVLPSLDDDRHVTPAGIAEFRDRGHLLVRHLATPEEMDAWGPVITDIAMGCSTETRPLGQRDGLGDAFLQIQNVWQADALAKRFVFAPRFARVAADLLGVDAVRMYHDQAIFKEPGADRTPFHQDQYYFPLDSDQIITMWMPLAPVSDEMGSMTFATGSHRLGHLGEFEASEASEAAFRAMIAERALELETYGAMEPGDATFHPGWTLHGAPPNPTDAMRAVMTVIWFADGLRGIEPLHEWHEKDYAKWLPDVRPGELAAGRLNPLVWSRV